VWDTREVQEVGSRGCDDVEGCEFWYLGYCG